MWTWYFYKGKKERSPLSQTCNSQFPCYLQSEIARDIASENLLAHLPLHLRDYIYRMHSCKENY